MDGLIDRIARESKIIDSLCGIVRALLLAQRQRRKLPDSTLDQIGFSLSQIECRHVEDDADMPL